MSGNATGGAGDPARGPSKHRGSPCGLVIIRGTVLLAGAGIAAAAIVFGLLGRAEIIVSYRHGHPSACAPDALYRPRLNCLGQETDTVTQAWMQPGGDLDGPDRYYIRVRRPTGAVQRIDATQAVYNVARPGDRAKLRLWHGIVVGLEVDGVRHDPGPPIPPDWTDWLGWTALAWDGFGVALWAARYRHPFAYGLGKPFAGLAAWTVEGLLLGCTVGVVLDAHRWWQYPLFLAGILGILALGWPAWAPEGPETRFRPHPRVPALIAALPGFRLRRDTDAGDRGQR